MLYVRLCTSVYLCACARLVLFIGAFLLMSGDCLWLFLLWKEISLWLAKYCIPSCKIQMHSWEVWQLIRIMALNRNAASVLCAIALILPPLKQFSCLLITFCKWLAGWLQNIIKFVKSRLTIWITAKLMEGTNLWIHSSPHLLEQCLKWPQMWYLCNSSRC